MGQVTSHHLSDLHIPDQVTSNKNHVTTTEPPQPQPPIQLPTKNRAPSPPRPPRYAVAQNRVLPFGVPKTSLRPVSAEFRHRFPDYNNIYGDQSDENEDIEETDPITSSENIDSSTSASNHDVAEHQGFANTENQPVPNNGYKRLHSSYGNLQQLKENRKHENDLLRSGNGYRPKSLVAFENETESMKPGKACLVDNGQIINLPQKSSFEMDYSFAVTYAQLAKHRRQQNLQKIREKEENWAENHPNLQNHADNRSSDRSNDRSDVRLDEHEHNLHEKYRDQNQHTDDKLVENRSHKNTEDRVINIDRKSDHMVDRKKVNTENKNESGIHPHGDIHNQHDINTHTKQHSNTTGHSNPTDRNSNGVNINENITDINETKVKYRAPPPPRKSGIEPPIDYDMSDDSDGSDIRVSIPECPRHENNSDYSRNSSALTSPRKGSDDSFAMVDLNGSVSNEHLSPTSTVDKTRRLNSLLQHDIIHAAGIRQVKLKRVNPKLPAQKSSDEITQTELSKICEEREKRQKVTPNKLELITEKTKERNLELTHSGAKKKDIFGTSISPITNSNKSSDVESRGQSSDVSFEKVEKPKDDESVKDYDIISNDEVETSESETKKERTILSLVNVNKSTYVKSGNIKSAKNSAEVKSANVRKSTEVKTHVIQTSKDDSFESSYENNHAEVGIKPSNLSTDWTPEHDLEESEDDEKLVLTSKTRKSSEGFKKTIVPSQGMGNTLNIKVANDPESTGNFRSLLKFNKLNCNIKRDSKTDVDKWDVDAGKSESEKSNNKSKSSDNKSKSSDGDKKVESFEIDFRSSKKKKSVKDNKDKPDSVNVKSNKKSSIKLAKRASNRKSKADVKNVPITKATHHTSISTLSSEDRSYTGHSSSSFCMESDEIRDDSLDGKVESDNVENIDDKTANKRVKKMRKLGYISTAKKKEKKRLQLYLQEQIDQQERRIEAERKKQREIKKQIRTLDSEEDSFGEDDELDEVVYKTKKSKSPPRAKSPPVSVQYVTQLPYTMPVLSQMNSLSLNPGSNAQIPQSYIPPYSGWYSNPALQYPALQYPQIPQFQIPQVGQMSNIQPQQPISYDLLQYMRLMEQNQLANQLNQNQPIPNWSGTEKQNGLLNTQQHDFSNSTQKPHVPNPTQFDNLNGITVNGSNNTNNSNSVMIDDALLSAMMSDYTHTKNGSITGKTLMEKRSNPIYDSSDDEINYNTKQTNIPVTVDVNGAKLTNHNTAIYGPVGYRPINFSPKQKMSNQSSLRGPFADPRWYHGEVTGIPGHKTGMLYPYMDGEETGIPGHKTGMVYPYMDGEETGIPGHTTGMVYPYMDGEVTGIPGHKMGMVYGEETGVPEHKMCMVYGEETGVPGHKTGMVYPYMDGEETGIPGHKTGMVYPYMDGEETGIPGHTTGMVYPYMDGEVTGIPGHKMGMVYSYMKPAEFLQKLTSH